MQVYTFKPEVSGSYSDIDLRVYVQEYTPKIEVNSRPMILICPGGGYEYTSDREADPLALAFTGVGYNAAILRYSCAPARYPTALLELAESVRIIRRHAAQWHTDPGHIFVLGCSAGGHLAAHLGIAWNKPEIMGQGMDLQMARPNGLILCYPVITSGEYAHHGSFHALLGERYDELRDAVSIEQGVGPDMPPVFLWHTYTDPAVPVENSLLLAGALRRQGISTEMHIFDEGGHGLALANRLTHGPGGNDLEENCSVWFSLAHAWIQKRCGL